ncbi:MAG: biotin synthase, partial [Mesorhizobium sp.]
VRPFITAEGWSPGALTDKSGLRQIITGSCEQLSLF